MDIVEMVLLIIGAIGISVAIISGMLFLRFDVFTQPEKPKSKMLKKIHWISLVVGVVGFVSSYLLSLL